MESGLEGRNNRQRTMHSIQDHRVSMESGLEGRNNREGQEGRQPRHGRLNGVRPRRPEQFCDVGVRGVRRKIVSMESGLEGRNN